MLKQPKGPSSDERMKQTRYIHAVGYYSALKKKAVLQYVITQRNVEDRHEAK